MEETDEPPARPILTRATASRTLLLPVAEQEKPKRKRINSITRPLRRFSRSKPKPFKHKPHQWGSGNQKLEDDAHLVLLEMSKEGKEGGKGTEEKKGKKWKKKKGAKEEREEREEREEKKMQQYKLRDEKTHAIRNEVAGLKDTVIHSLDTTLKRGESLDTLYDTAMQLTDTAFSFRENAEDLHSTMKWKKYRCYALFGCTVLLILVGISFAIAVAVCGPKLKCDHSPPAPPSPPPSPPAPPVHAQPPPAAASDPQMGPAPGAL